MSVKDVPFDEPVHPRFWDMFRKVPHLTVHAAKGAQHLCFSIPQRPEAVDLAASQHPSRHALHSHGHGIMRVPVFIRVPVVVRNCPLHRNKVGLSLSNLSMARELTVRGAGSNIFCLRMIVLHIHLCVCVFIAIPWVCESWIRTGRDLNDVDTNEVSLLTSTDT